MKLIYRGITYERHPSETPSRPFQEVRPVEVPAGLAVHKLIYRGETYYKLSPQDITFSVNVYHNRRRNRMILQDKVALVTGGTTGIGRATAIALGAAGAKVVFSGRRDAEGEKTAKLIHETGTECLYVHSDASSEADIKALVQKTVATYGQLDCAFNNVGNEGLIKPLHEQSIEDFDKLMATNVRGLFLCMKYEIQHMLSQGSGVIVNNSSIAGLFGFSGGSPYSASKHAVMGLTRSAALDYAKQGIRINAVNPGNIATEGLDRVFKKVDITADAVTAMVPMGRIAQAEEVAQAVVFLCSDAASYITGQPLVIDGGFTVS